MDEPLAAILTEIMRASGTKVLSPSTDVGTDSLAPFSAGFERSSG